jgi:Flp pilus assembly protein TadD
MHGSVIYNIYLFLSYTVVSLVLFYISRDTTWKHKAKILGIYTLATLLVSILPPIGILQYRLLFLFLNNMSFIGKNISEWQPLLMLDPTTIAFYLINLVVILPAIIIGLKKRWYAKLFVFTPLLIFIILPFFASRNFLTAYVVLAFFFALSISIIHFQKIHKLLKITLLLIFVGITLFYARAIYISKSAVTSDPLPKHAADFLLKHQFQGNMMNEFSQGGYLLYRLYPKYKVLIDLRVDVYLCCELPIYQNIVMDFSKPNAIYYQELNQHLLKPYSISYAVLSVEEKPDKTLRILASNPNWQLVYWDDIDAILVKKTSLNRDILKQFGVTAATPFGSNPVANENLSRASIEYQRMISITDSAISRNALGYIYLKQHNIPQAQVEFEKAIHLNPYFDSPYANLAEIVLHNGDSETAIKFYEKAKRLNPNRAFTYLRLAQLYITYQQDTQKAQETLQEGIHTLVNPKDIQSLQQALSTL